MAENGKTTVVFDLSRPTARDMMPHIPKLRQLRPRAFASVLAMIVVETSVTDEPQNVEAYKNLPMDGAFNDLWRSYLAAVKEVKPDIPFATFDLGGVTAAEFDDLMAMVEVTNIDGLAGMLAKFVVKCPLVDDPSNPEAYLALQHFTQFVPLVNKLQEAGNDLLKRFL